MALQFNLDAVLERVGGDRELLAQMADVVLEELDALVAAVRAALEGDDGPGLEKSAHRLKGTIGNFEVPQLFELAYQVEAAGRYARFEDAQTSLATLESHLGEFRELLERLALGTQ